VENNEVTKGKGKKKTGRKPRERIVYHVDAGHIDDYAAPGHALSEGFTAEMNNQSKPDCDKNMSHAVPTITSDIGQRYQPDHSHPAPRDPAGNPRVNAPRGGKRTRVVGSEAAIPVSSTDGRYAYQATAAARAGDVGSMHVPVEGEDPSSVKALGTPSANPFAYALAYAQEQAAKGAAEQAASGSLRQSSTVTEALATLRTARGNVQDLGFAPDSAVPGGYSHAGVAVLRTLDAASHAGEYTDAHGRDVLSQVNYSPYRPDSHQAATGSGSNGSHSLGDVQSNAVSCKSRKDLMRELLFGA
jgi:hypothetical protein